MDYHFFDPHHLPSRRGTNSVKWDILGERFGREDLLPLWVADMDFPSPPCMVKALQQAADFGIYGYFQVPQGYQDAFLQWEKTRHGVSVSPDWLRYTPGVVTSIYWAINALTQPGDGVAILTPCYYPFMDAVADTARRLVCSELVRTPQRYTVDLEDFERKLTQQQVKLFLLCSPHNPVGRAWGADELGGMLEICQRHRVLVISDEIHQDILFGSHRHISCLGLPDYFECMICLTAPSKTFNMAGLQNSFVIIPDTQLREKFDCYVKTLGLKKGSSLGYLAAQAGYAQGGGWLEEVLDYIQGNYTLLRQTLTDSLPDIGMDALESTYMSWIDLSAYVLGKELVPTVQDKARLAVDYGFWFWPKGQAPENDAHIRLNLATSRSNIHLAAQRLIDAIRS